MSSESNDVIIKDENVLCIKRQVLYNDKLRDIVIYENVLNKCKLLGIIVDATHYQREALLGYIRHLGVAAKRLGMVPRKSLSWKSTIFGHSTRLQLQNPKMTNKKKGSFFQLFLDWKLTLRRRKENF